MLDIQHSCWHPLVQIVQQCLLGDFIWTGERGDECHWIQRGGIDLRQWNLDIAVVGPKELDPHGAHRAQRLVDYVVDHAVHLAALVLQWKLGDVAVRRCRSGRQRAAVSAVCHAHTNCILCHAQHRSIPDVGSDIAAFDGNEHWNHHYVALVNLVHRFHEELVIRGISDMLDDRIHSTDRNSDCNLNVHPEVQRHFHYQLGHSQASPWNTVIPR